MSERNQAIIKAAKEHIAGCIGQAAPEDAFNCWNVLDLPTIRGVDSDMIRDRLAAEIRKQLARNMYVLIDTFNDRVLCRHRTIAACVNADSMFQRRLKKNNGNNCYIPTTIKSEGAKGKQHELSDAERDEKDEAEYALYNG